MEQMLTELMERLPTALAKSLSSGTEVRTPRGYGIVVGHGPLLVIVELEGDGVRVPFRAEQLQVVERVAT